MPTPSIADLKRAIQIQEDIERLRTELESILNSSAPDAASPKAARVTKDKSPRKRRQMSPEAKARIVAAQKKRWANFRKNKS